LLPGAHGNFGYVVDYLNTLPLFPLQWKFLTATLSFTSALPPCLEIWDLISSDSPLLQGVFSSTASLNADSMPKILEERLIL